MSTQKTIEKPTKSPSAGVVSPVSKLVKKKGKLKQEKKVRTIASVAQDKLKRLEKQEKTLKAIIEKRKTHVAKLQGNLTKLNEKLKKVQEQKTAELKSIQSLVEAFKDA
jgi:predicted nuclease with TOPRIM domain